jgi:hypothetical protein
MLIASIDVGTTNCALVVYDSVQHAVVAATVADLRVIDGVRVVPGDQNVVAICVSFVENFDTEWTAVDLVVIEKQMTRRMCQIQYALEALLVARGDVAVLQIAPRSVKMHFDMLGRGNHAANKRRAIAKLKSMLAPAGIAQLAALFPRKQDDVADAVLQALFAAAKAPVLLQRQSRCCGRVG